MTRKRYYHLLLRKYDTDRAFFDLCGKIEELKASQDDVMDAMLLMEWLDNNKDIKLLDYNESREWPYIHEASSTDEKGNK